MKVLFITKGEETLASTRYRVLNLLPLLEEQNIESEWITLSRMSNTGIRSINKALFAYKTLRASFNYDLVYIQKVLLPKRYLCLLTNLYGNVIYDFDDAIYSPYPWQEANDEERVQKLRSTLETVSAVTTGSPVLADFANQHAEQVYCLPTAIPKEPYEEPQSEQTSILGDENNSVIIGWIGNPENLRYLQTIEDTLSGILDKYDEATLIIITSGKKPLTPLINREDVYYLEWSLDSEIELLSQADIGIRPLIDDDWTQGKGGFTSVVQCMALACPVVVTPVGMLSEIVEHGRSGFHAESKSEWIKYLGQLIENPELREKMGECAYSTVDKQRFWADQRAVDLITVLRSVIESSHQNYDEWRTGYEHD